MKLVPAKSILTLVLALGAALGCVGLALAATSQGASGERPGFSTTPALSPAFGWDRSDYAVRCAGGPTRVEVESPDGWRVAVGSAAPQSGTFSVDLALKPGRAFTVRFIPETGNPVRHYFVRCLPADFPEYKVTGHWKGGPRLVVAQLPNQYAAAFDRNGAPVWWYRAPDGSPNDAKLLSDGTLAYAPVQGVNFRRFQIRSPEGKAIRTVEAAGGPGTDIHDLVLLKNGNYLLGAHRLVRNVDTSRFGGDAKATIDTAQLQEQTPSGRLVWKWDAYPRIGLRETGRWWKTITGWGQPYDVHHWNSIERRGRSILLSFRHLDAVLEIDRRSGRIRWKLGGVKTNRSLRVKGDRHRSYPFGGQHDARYQSGGTITAFDNATNLTRQQPRAVRFRIQPRRRLATLVDEVRDPQVGVSVGMASARLTGAGWFIGWGAIGSRGIAGAYGLSGDPIFRLITPESFSYRLNPVSSKRPTTQRLRKAMSRMAGAQGT